MTSDAGQRTTKSCAACLYECAPDARFCARCGVAFLADASLPGDGGARRDSATGAPVGAAPSQPSPSRGAIADPLVGRVVADRYRILSLLGRGGMGVVYRVEHTHIGKVMAMKLLSGELSRDAALVRRFRVEAKAVSKLGHPNTVQVFDFGESARLVYLVMEYLPGRDLGSIIQSDGPLDYRRAARICAQVAASVAEAHERGIVHRDIKPENVMVCDTTRQRDFVKVLDFGIAKLRDAEEQASQTQSGSVVGTPYYMAPEQIRADPVDGRVDVYALGAVLYKALTGVPPFQSSTPMGVLTMHLTQPLTPMGERTSRRDLPPDAEAIVAKALEKDPARRYQSMDEFREVLTESLARLGETELPAQQATRSFPVLGFELATRSDVDEYERRLSRTYTVGSLVAAVVLLLAFYVAYLVGDQKGWSDGSHETEPNDEPAQASPLAPGHTVHGFLGKRKSRTYGDVDMFAFDLPLAESATIDLRVSAIPNIDLILELVRKGDSRPMWLSDGGRVGEPEVIPALTLRGGTYYVRVRERFQGVRWPTENISDPYGLSLRLLEDDPLREREPDDDFENAGSIAPGQARTGLLGWPGDRDLYCFPRELAPLAVDVRGPGSLDVVLALVDKKTRAVREQNALGPGQGEVLQVPTLSAQAEPCVEVRVREGAAGARFDTDATYTLSLRGRP